MIDHTYQAKTYYGIGLCYSSWRLKDYERTREFFKRAIEVEPKGATGRSAQDQLSKLPG